MKHAGLKIALTVSAAVTFGLALAGCSGGSGKAPYDHIVTFDYNLGSLSSTIENQYLGVMNESLIAMQPGYNGDFKLRQLEGYEFKGWYLPEKDAEGMLVCGDDGRVIVGEEWNFRTGRVTEDITLYANFQKKAKITLLGRAEVDGEITEVEIYDSSKKVFEELFQGSVGDLIARPDDSLAPTAEGFTFVDYYEDEDLTKPFVWPCELKEGGVTVYAKFLEIDLRKYVTTAKEFVSAIESGSDIVVMNDLDFADVEWKGNYDYSGTIKGNNHVITGLSCELASNRNKLTYGLFGRLGEGCKVSDLTFEGVSLLFHVTTQSNGGVPYSVSMFADTIAREASFENLRFSGTLTVSNTDQKIQVNTYEISRNNRGADLTEYFTVTLPSGNEE